MVGRDAGDLTAADAVYLYDLFRGGFGTSDVIKCVQKDFAIAYDRFICLNDGDYQLNWTGLSRDGQNQGWIAIRKNNTGYTVMESQYGPGGSNGRGNLSFSVALAGCQRGDWFYLHGGNLEGSGDHHGSFSIVRL